MYTHIPLSQSLIYIWFLCNNNLASILNNVDSMVEDHLLFRELYYRLKSESAKKNWNLPIHLHIFYFWQRIDLSILLTNIGDGHQFLCADYKHELHNC